jgi:hypothetical protein
MHRRFLAGLQANVEYAHLVIVEYDFVFIGREFDRVLSQACLDQAAADEQNNYSLK